MPGSDAKRHAHSHSAAADVPLMDPPYPPDTRANGWRFELDLGRVRQSDTWRLASPQLRPWLLMLWATAWEQSPAGTLPNDDEAIAQHIGMEYDEFRTARRVLLRKWERCSDGRLYHPVLTEIVWRMLEGRKSTSARVKAWRSKAAVTRYGNALPTASEIGEKPVTGKTPDVTRYSVPTPIGKTDDVTRYGNATGTGTGTGTGKRSKASALLVPDPPAPATLFPLPNDADGANNVSPHDLPSACPHVKVLALWAELLPQLPQPAAWRGQREQHLRQRWRELAVEHKWQTEQDGLRFFAKLFRYVGKSRFLTGRVSAKGDREPFVAELPWLVRPENFLKVIEGRYHPTKD